MRRCDTCCRSAQYPDLQGLKRVAWRMRGMVSDGLWAQYFDFESPNGLERLHSAESKARRTYAREAIDRLVSSPVKALRSAGVTGAVVFDRVAFLREPGGFSIASFRDGVLVDPDFEWDPWLEGLPLRRSAKELGELLLLLVVRELAIAMSKWRGDPVDLRGKPVPQWTFEQGVEGACPQVEAELRACVAALPRTSLGRLFNDIAKALEFERVIASAARWMIAGWQDTARAYQCLESLQGVAEAHHSHRGSGLIAVAITIAIEARQAPESVDAAVGSLREKSSMNGVSRVGWRLLVNSTSRYWNQVLRDGCTEPAVWVALLLGQASPNQRLPKPREVRHIVDAAFEAGVECELRHVPPQIWRALRERVEGRKVACEPDLQDVLAWAARMGGAMPKTTRRATWTSLRRHAVEYALSQFDCGSIDCDPGVLARVRHDGIVAHRISNVESLDKMATLMRNCLAGYREDLQVGRAIFYLATKGSRRAAISLARDGKGGPFIVDQVKGPANVPAAPCFEALAPHLSYLWIEHHRSITHATEGLHVPNPA